MRIEDQEDVAALKEAKKEIDDEFDDELVGTEHGSTPSAAAAMNNQKNQKAITADQ